MITLQKFGPPDYSTLINWVDNPEFLMQFAGPAFSFPLTAVQLDALASDASKHLFKVVDEQEKTIGHAEIHLTENSCYLARIVIGEPQLRGRGLGKLIVRELLEYAFINLGQPKVELTVFDWNTSAIKCYEKLGFVLNPAKRRECVVNGKTWVALGMFLEK